MNIIDIILGVLLLLGLLRGLYNGFFVEVASLLALIAGIYGAIHFSYFVTGFIESKLEWEAKYVSLVSFSITFIIIITAVSLAGKALTKLANFAALGFLNKIFGGLFGFLKIALILSVILMVFSKMNKPIGFLDTKDIEESVLFEPIGALAPMIYPMILNNVNKNE